jgi:tetratricopeptide (TPR) repeat protein
MLDHSTSLNKQAVARELPFQNVMALILSRRFEEARIALDKIEVSMEGLSERKAYTLAFLSWAQGEYRSALSQLDIFSFEGGLWRDATMLRVRAAGRLAADPSLSESDRSRFRFDQRENLEKILQRQPNDPEAVVRLARLMASSGLGAAAQDLLAVASAAAGDSFSPWYSVISAELLEDTQRYEAAMDRYRQALSRFPRHSGLRIWMGSFLALLGDQDSIHQLIGGSKDVDALADDGLELAKRLAGSFQFEEDVILLRRTLRLCESGARRCSRIPDLSEALAKYLLLMNPAASDEAEAFLARSRSINPDPQ